MMPAQSSSIASSGALQPSWHHTLSSSSAWPTRPKSSSHLRMTSSQSNNSHRGSSHSTRKSIATGSRQVASEPSEHRSATRLRTHSRTPLRWRQGALCITLVCASEVGAINGYLIKEVLPFKRPSWASTELENMEDQFIDISSYNILTSTIMGPSWALNYESIGDSSFAESHLLDYTSISGAFSLQVPSCINLLQDSDIRPKAIHFIKAYHPSMEFLIQGITSPRWWPSHPSGPWSSNRRHQMAHPSNMVRWTSSSGTSELDHPTSTLILIDSSIKISIFELFDKHQHGHRIVSAICFGHQPVASASAAWASAIKPSDI